MALFNTIRIALQGRKSFLTATLLVVWAIGGFWLEQLDINEAITLIFGATGLSTLKAGQARESERLEKDIKGE